MFGMLIASEYEGLLRKGLSGLIVSGDGALYDVVALSLWVSLIAVALAAAIGLPLGALLAP